MRKLGWDPDDTHRVTISEKAAAITVTDITLTKTSVALGEAFGARLFVTNPTGETPWKALAAVFGINTEGFTPHFLFVVEGNVPLGDTEWVIACNGAEVGTWDVLGCIGYLTDTTVFNPEQCFGYLDMLTVY